MPFTAAEGYSMFSRSAWNSHSCAAPGGGDPLVYKGHNLHLLGIVLPVGDGDGAIMETSSRLLVGHIALVVLLPCACGREHEAAHERAVRDAPPPPPRVASRADGGERHLEQLAMVGVFTCRVSPQIKFLK